MVGWCRQDCQQIDAGGMTCCRAFGIHRFLDLSVNEHLVKPPRRSIDQKRLTHCHKVPARSRFQDNTCWPFDLHSNTMRLGRQEGYPRQMTGKRNRPESSVFAKQVTEFIVVVGGSRSIDHRSSIHQTTGLHKTRHQNRSLQDRHSSSIMSTRNRVSIVFDREA